MVSGYKNWHTPRPKPVDGRSLKGLSANDESDLIPSKIYWRGGWLWDKFSCVASSGGLSAQLFEYGLKHYQRVKAQILIFLVAQIEPGFPRNTGSAINCIGFFATAAAV